MDSSTNVRTADEAKAQWDYIKRVAKEVRRTHLGCFGGYPCKYGDGNGPCAPRDLLAEELEDAFDVSL